MQTARIVGSNIRLLLNAKGIDKSTFAKKLGYSIFDVEKLCDARLFTNEEDIKDISAFFNVSPKELMTEKKEAEYKGNGFIHCMGKFSKPENKDLILNIFDMYCDLKEAMNN